jgi:hypothetical protein
MQDADGAGNECAPPVLGWARFVRRSCFEEQRVLSQEPNTRGETILGDGAKRGQQRESGGASVLTDFKNKPKQQRRYILDRAKHIPSSSRHWIRARGRGYMPV